MATPRYAHMSVYVQNRLYLFGGLTGQFRGLDDYEAEPTGSCEVFNPESNTWEEGSEMALPVAFSGVVVPDKNVFYVFGGRTEERVTTDLI